MWHVKWIFAVFFLTLNDAELVHGNWEDGNLNSQPNRLIVKQQENTVSVEIGEAVSCSGRSLLLSLS